MPFHGDKATKLTTLPNGGHRPRKLVSRYGNRADLEKQMSDDGLASKNSRV
jgi:hypothetical protein